MKESLKNKVKQLESQIGDTVLGDVVFQIGGQEEDGETIANIVVINGETLDQEEFNSKYPNFKPSGISVILGEWDI